MDQDGQLAPATWIRKELAWTRTCSRMRPGLILVGSAGTRTERLGPWIRMGSAGTNQDVVSSSQDMARLDQVEVSLDPDG